MKHPSTYSCSPGAQIEGSRSPSDWETEVAMAAPPSPHGPGQFCPHTCHARLTLRGGGDTALVSPDAPPPPPHAAQGPLRPRHPSLPGPSQQQQEWGGAWLLPLSPEGLSAPAAFQLLPHLVNKSG